MAVSPIVTLGFGTWGSVNKLPTVGYAIGAVVVVELPPGREGVALDWRLHGRAKDGRQHGKADDWRLHGAYEGRD